MTKPLFEAPGSRPRIFLSFFCNAIELIHQGNVLYDSATFFLNTFLVEILIDVWPNTTTILMHHKHTIADNNVHRVTYLQHVVVTTSEFPDDKVCVSESYPCRQKVMIIVNDIMS